ncbi:MAG: murein biosynthesis integral membrane protein MurJ [Chloroflexi bacterium]|nr:MAG: murein biosynthesis integral membrane protein MurJ [Chloroflexota bacterium]
MNERPEGAPGEDSPAEGLGRFLQQGTRSQSVFAAAGIVAMGFVASRLLGLLRSVAIAHAFGTDPQLSAYWVAFRLPDLVFQVLAGATLSAAFIPTFSRVRMRNGEASAWRLASDVLNIVSIATTIMAIIAFILAPVIVPWLAPGLGNSSGRALELRQLAVNLTRVMLLSPIMFGVSGMVTGILNARQHFFAPALAPLIYNLSIIAGALLLARPFGVRGLAAGVVIGSVGHLLVQLPALRTVGMRWAPSIDLNSPGVREVARLMGPRVIGLAAAQLNFITVVFFASYVSDEAISALTYAFLIAMLPVGVVGMAISTAVFPTLAQQAAAQQMETMRESLSRSLRLILFLAIPASVALMLLAWPVVRITLQRGAFDGHSTDLVAAAVIWYSIAVFAHSGTEILSRGFYAVADTRTPVALAVLAVIVNAGLSAALVSPFGVRGLAAATSVAAIIEFALLFRALTHRIGDMRGRGVATSIYRTVAATAVMAEVMVIATLALRWFGADIHTLVGALLICVVAGIGGAAAFLVTAAWLHSQEVEEILDRLGSS